MKKAIAIFLLGALFGAGAVFAHSLRVQLQLAELRASTSLHQAVFSLEYYHDHGPERIGGFLEREVKCRGDAMKTTLEVFGQTYPKWFYEPELPLRGRTVERARKLVGAELECEPEADA